ncbi:MAG: hypothetical protein M1115_06730 [Actinobacteria bacterium]|nr:hypothetical protein [Actinomycetota bacterium]
MAVEASDDLRAWTRAGLPGCLDGAAGVAESLGEREMGDDKPAPRLDLGLALEEPGPSEPDRAPGREAKGRALPVDGARSAGSPGESMQKSLEPSN